MKKTLSSLLLLIMLKSVLGQPRWTAKDVVKFEDAEIYMEITDYKTALDLFIPLYEKYGAVEEIEYKIGYCYYHLGDIEEAENYLLKAKENNDPNALFYLGLLYHRQESFDKSIAHFQAFKNSTERKIFENEKADRQIEISIRARKMIENPKQVRIYNVGPGINSEFDDYAPLITADESMMAFTSRRSGSTGDEKDPYGKFMEDIYLGFRKENEWKSVENIGPPVNTATHDAAVGLSANGNSLIIYRTNEDLTAGDLYLTHDDDGKWSKPELLNDAINTKYQEASASLTADERVIYFSSNRPGGYGGLDIYRIVRLGNDEWSLPMNLGPTVNTEYDEDAPFIHPDGKTLYFSSKGHETMGGYDIFKTSLGEEYWSTPENLGYPTNTVKDDIFFVMTADGNRGYYSNNAHQGSGGHDIYAVSFENNVESLRIVKGHVQDESGQTESVSVYLYDEEGENYGIYNTNPLTGNFIIILPPDQNFRMVISAEGYEEIEEDLYYKGGTALKERDQNYILKRAL